MCRHWKPKRNPSRPTKERSKNYKQMKADSLFLFAAAVMR